MKKAVRRLLYNTLVVFMAVLMASMTAVQVFAAGRNRDKKTERDIASGKLYIKDVIIVNESEKMSLRTSAAYEDYIVLSDPIKTFSSDSEYDNLYFAVKTTENPNEAITDIKAMNMNGDYDFDAYRQYLDGVNEWVTAKAETTMTALKEFQANYAKGTPSAVFAYNMMNYLVGDNEDVPLGDFFVADEHKNDHALQVKNIVMKANIATLTYFRQLLLVACSETSTDGSFVDKLLTHTNGNDLIPNPDNSKYNTAAEDLMNSMIETREVINAYRKALSEHGDGLDDYLKETRAQIDEIMTDEDADFNSEEYIKADEQNAVLKDILSGYTLCTLFDEVYYTDKDGVQYSLSDILAKDPEAENEADRLTPDMLLPVVALMTDGQRALCGCGFDKLVASVINDYSAEDSEENGMLEKVLEFWQSLSEEGLVSVYAGVDLSLYDPNGIAMVGKSGELFQTSDVSLRNFPLSAFGSALMMAGSIVGLVDSIAMLKKTAGELSTLATKIQASKSTITTLTNDLSSATGTALDSINQQLIVEKQGLEKLMDAKRVVSFTNGLAAAGIILSVIALIISIVFFILDIIDYTKPGEYTQVPRVLVNGIEKDEYDERQQKMTHTQMIFYKGIIDPFMSDEKAEKCVSPSKVQDILDWSLDTKDREWIALYATKDGRVGNPVIFDGNANTLVTLVEGQGKTYSALEEEKGFNSRVNIFNKDNYTVCGNGVIVYDRDTEVTSNAKTGLGASMRLTNGYFILFLCLAVLAGAGIGVGMTFIVKKYKKKSAASH